ncbi:beta-lactamase/transpeptidase-like protein [Athelia psychrophila]|uniref:Beta-lactamase/transpeptidase-like protein n=1 Tax=Athelia psychrophila TaxID=1759441 RepID=A0A166KW01_9AGAM|nr:beta-lactamase/transpeptidase-like protein [Fibularhizoctonia sp. CBS 109695]
MSEHTFEDVIQAAVENKIIPGAVLVATNKSGTLNYAKAFGTAGILPDAKPLTLDSTFWIASCTKLVTTIACMQCVERGLFSLDSPEDVAKLLPEYAEPEILTGLDDQGKPILVPAKNRITLRMMLTHTSGMSYDIMNPTIAAWRKSRGEPCGSLVNLEGCRSPLVFEPGEEWEYGTGIDWAGQMVERANGGRSLETYLQENIWGPLDIHHMTFHLEKKEEVRNLLADMTARMPETDLLVPTGDHVIADPAKDALGGSGLYGDAVEYMKILNSILRDDGKLLKSASIKEMFQPQLSEKCKTSLVQKLVKHSLEAGAPLSCGLGGAYNLEDLKDGRRRKGSLTCGGLPNLFWWIDQQAGVAGMYASQVVPTNDLKSAELFLEFEKGIYKMLGSS